MAMVQQRARVMALGGMAAAPAVTLVSAVVVIVTRQGAARGIARAGSALQAVVWHDVLAGRTR